MAKAKKRVLVFKRQGIEEEERREKENNKFEKQEINIWAWATQVGLEISLPIALGAIIGSGLDSRLGTQPRITLSLLFLGIIVSFYNLFKRIRSVG